MSAPLAFPLAKTSAAICFWLSLVGAIIFLALAFKTSVGASSAFPRGSFFITIVPIVGMLVCASGFFAFAYMYFWALPLKPEAENAKISSTEDPPMHDDETKRSQYAISVVNSHGNIIAPSGGNNSIVNNITNQAPEPTLEKIDSSTMKKNDDGSVTIYQMIEVKSPYPAGNLYIEVKSNDIVEFEALAQRGGVSIEGASAVRQGYGFRNLVSPFGKYLLKIRLSRAPSLDAPIAIDYNFN